MLSFGSSVTPRPAAPVWTVKTPPTETPDVWVASARAFIGLAPEDTTRDPELTAFLFAAAAEIERYCSLTLFETTFTGTLMAFADEIQVAKRPFKTVDAVEYAAYGTGEILSPAAGTYHVLKSLQDTGVIYRGDGVEWPATARRMDAVRIDVTAGFTVATMPPEIVHALLMTVAALDGNRGDCGCGGGGGGYASGSVFAAKSGGVSSEIIPAGARAMLSRWRYVRVGAV